MGSPSPHDARHSWQDTNASSSSEYSLENVSEYLVPLLQTDRNRIIFLTFCSTLFFISILGNIFIILLLVKRLFLSGHSTSSASSPSSSPCPAFTSFSSSLLLNLSILYVLLNLLAFVPNMLYFVSTSWKFGQIGCKLTFYIENVGFSAAIWTLVAISFESATNHQHWLLAPIVLSFIWLLNLLLHLPHVFTFKLINVGSSDGHRMSMCLLAAYCVNIEAYSTFGFLFGYLLPALMLSFRLMTTMLRHVMAAPRSVDLSNRNSFQLLLATATCFILGLLPYQVRIMWATWSSFDATKAWSIFVLVAYLLSYLATAVHPILFLALSPSSHRRRRIPCMPCHSHQVAYELSVNQDAEEAPPKVADI